MNHPNVRTLHEDRTTVAGDLIAAADDSAQLRANILAAAREFQRLADEEIPPATHGMALDADDFDEVIATLRQAAASVRDAADLLDKLHHKCRGQ